MAVEDVGVDPEGFERRAAQYVEWLRTSYFSEATARERGKRLRYFIAWAAERGLTRPSECTRPVLEAYQGSLFRYRKANGEPLALTNQAHQIAALKGFFKWLVRSNLLLSNPASDLLLPRIRRRLPKYVLSREEVERVLNLTDVATPRGLRDRAILEVLYSTGLRRMEIAALHVVDVDVERRTVMVREGKGRKQRVVPIGKRALAWVEKYLADARPLLVVPPDEGFLFLTQYGKGYPPGSISNVARRYLVRAELGKAGSAHIFRHTMATLMLEGGADLRSVQEMLGHATVSTTEIYTHVSIRRLQEVHAATHPAEARRAPGDASQDAEEAGSAPPAEEPPAAPPAS